MYLELFLCFAKTFFNTFLLCHNRCMPLFETTFYILIIIDKDLTIKNVILIKTRKVRSAELDNKIRLIFLLNKKLFRRFHSKFDTLDINKCI